MKNIPYNMLINNAASIVKQPLEDRLIMTSSGQNILIDAFLIEEILSRLLCKKDGQILQDIIAAGKEPLKIYPYSHVPSDYDCAKGLRSTFDKEELEDTACLMIESFIKNNNDEFPYNFTYDEYLKMRGGTTGCETWTRFNMFVNRYWIEYNPTTGTYKYTDEFFNRLYKHLKK